MLKIKKQQNGLAIVTVMMLATVVLIVTGAIFLRITVSTKEIVKVEKHALSFVSDIYDDGIDNFLITSVSGQSITLSEDTAYISESLLSSGRLDWTKNNFLNAFMTDNNNIAKVMSGEINTIGYVEG